jgi:hypothetical protein
MKRLILFEDISIRDMADVHENLRAVVIWRDESETAIFKVVCDCTKRSPAAPA